MNGNTKLNVYVYCHACKTNKHCTITFYFISFDFYLNGPNMSTAWYVKGAASWNLSLGISAIIWTPIFRLSLRQITQLNTTNFVMELALIIQKPLSFISFKVTPLPQCAALRRHHLTINSVTLDFLGRITECIYSSFSTDLLLRLPTQRMPLPTTKLCLRFFSSVSVNQVNL